MIRCKKFYKPIPEKKYPLLIFELQPTLRCSKKYVLDNTSRVQNNVELEERVEIIDALREVIGSDDRVSDMEKDFFNMVVKALDIPETSL